MKGISEKDIQWFLDRGATVSASIADQTTGIHKPVAEVATSPAKKPKQNKTEARHAMDLEARKEQGEVEGYWFEAIKLRLNDRCFFTPDFFVRYRGGAMGFEEVKGPYFWEDARVKLLTAARLFPMFSFRLYQTGKPMVVISPE